MRAILRRNDRSARSKGGGIRRDGRAGFGGRQTGRSDVRNPTDSTQRPTLTAVLLAGVIALLTVVPVMLLAFKEGPYPNVTGGFGEPTCRVCHLDNALNAPGGKLEIAGVPASYAPGTAYRITVTLTREDLKRGGFEVSARFASGKLRGKQAGSWRLLDNRVQMIPGAVDKSLQFVQHTLAGSRAPSAGSNSWTIEWTAPANAGAPVLFNVAGNATNNDDSPLGDFIYVKAARSLPGRLTRNGRAGRSILGVRSRVAAAERTRTREYRRSNAGRPTGGATGLLERGEVR